MKNFKFQLQSIIGILFLAVALNYGCRTEEEATTTVTPVDSTSEYTEGNLIYGLPRTQLYFDIQLIRKTIIPGPYHSYGKKLLGISSIPDKKKLLWSIEDICIKKTTELDYEQLYEVKPGGEFSISQHNLTKKGWIMPITNDLESLPGNDFYPQTEYPKGIVYKDLSVRKFVGEETKTEYKNVWKDSLYAKVPVKETKMVKKSAKEKAREAASFIFMIREKRFELLSGMSDFYPEGKALETGVDELNRLEDSYLSLFTGKTYTDTINYTLFMDPNLKDTEDANILFRFSENKGLLEPGKNDGIPVWVEFEILEKGGLLENYFRNSIESEESEKSDNFFYRFPSHSLVKLKYGDELISKKYIDIFQFGPLVKIPSAYLNEQQIIKYHNKEEND
ncbi:MAG: DUF4831 family protein [Bacteroidota bacterium]